MAAGDDSEDEPASSPRVVMRTFFWSPADKAPDEDELMAEVLLTAVGDTGYPGNTTSSPNWPGVAPGDSGVNNAFSGKWCDTSAFATLGRLEVVPGWPGMEVFPPQPQIAQTRAMLGRYQAGGGSVREAVLEGCGHGPPIERSAEVREQLLAHIKGAG
jgi:hypothetical protein